MVVWHLPAALTDKGVIIHGMDGIACAKLKEKRKLSLILFIDFEIR